MVVAVVAFAAALAAVVSVRSFAVGLVILVVAGSVTNYPAGDRTCRSQVYTAGAGFIDAGGGDVHMLRNESDAPAETIAVQLLPKDAVRRIDAPAPGNCPT